MPLQDAYLQIPLEQIHVKRDLRQRRELNVEDLKLSIRLHGVIQPIVVQTSGGDSPGYVLISGERRLTASRELGLVSIPARLASDLSETERRIIELEENVKRQELPWQDEALAIKSIHDLYVSLDPTWTQAKTAEAIGLEHVTNQLRVAEEILREDKYVLSAPGMRAAYNIILRRDSRTVADAMDELLHSTSLPIPAPNLAAESVRQELYQEILEVESILNMDFHKFAATYSGQPFNLIHCDFPYGIGHHKSQQGGSIAGTQTIHESYEDSEETYWALCKTLSLHINTLCAPSAHIFFWLSSDIERQIETIRFFAEHAPSLEFQTVSCIWVKSDNRGILPDPNRGPRRIYETALIGSRGDRQIIRPVSNAYSAPTTKEIHQSEKPEPVLRHFLSMFVDENTRLLDPTCGSGSALRAAESLGAGSTLGLEINEDFCQAARRALNRTRVLRNAS